MSVAVEAVPEPTASQRRRIRELEVMVAETIIETHDTTTIMFFTGNDHLEYQAGHFLTLDPHDFPELERFTAFLEDVKGKKEPPRAYSLASSPQSRIRSPVYMPRAWRRPRKSSSRLRSEVPRFSAKSRACSGSAM